MLIIYLIVIAIGIKFMYESWTMWDLPPEEFKRKYEKKPKKPKQKKEKDEDLLDIYRV